MYDFTHQWQMEVLLNEVPVDEYVVNDNVFVEGRKGSQLKLKLTNSSDETVMFVPSLDGLSIYDEQPASLNSHGIIVDPLSSSIVDVWAISNDPLTFVGDKTFDKRSGKGTDNVGVFGCLVYRKRLWPQIKHTASRSYKSPMHQSAFYSSTDPVYVSTSSASDVAHGSSILGIADINNYAEITPQSVDKLFHQGYDDVFVKRDANYPDGVMTVFYDSQRGLEKRGIQLKYKMPHTPDAFPVAKGMRRR